MDAPLMTHTHDCASLLLSGRVCAAATLPPAYRTQYGFGAVGGAGEWLLLPHDEAERVDVGRLVGALPRQNLGGGVGGRPAA